MILILLLTTMVALAPTSTNIQPSFLGFLCLVIPTLLISAYLSNNTLNIQSIGSGIGIYSGLFLYFFFFKFILITSILTVIISFISLTINIFRNLFFLLSKIYVLIFNNRLNYFSYLILYILDSKNISYNFSKTIQILKVLTFFTMIFSILLFINKLNLFTYTLYLIWPQTIYCHSDPKFGSLELPPLYNPVGTPSIGEEIFSQDPKVASLVQVKIDKQNITLPSIRELKLFQEGYTTGSGEVVSKVNSRLYDSIGLDGKIIKVSGLCDPKENKK